MKARLIGRPFCAAALQFLLEHVVEMAHVEEAGGVIGDGELLDARDVASIFDGDGRVVAEDVKECDGVVGQSDLRGD